MRVCVSAIERVFVGFSLRLLPPSPVEREREMEGAFQREGVRERERERRSEGGRGCVMEVEMSAEAVRETSFHDPLLCG